MKFNARSILLVLATLGLCGSGANAQTYGFATLPPGTLNHTTASAVAKVLKEKAGMNMLVQPTAGDQVIVPMVGRVLQAPLRVGGREYPAGTALIPSIYLSQRRAASWEEPERFLPDRFLGKRASPYEFFPFGGGARRCIGMAFALFEMRVVLREIVREPLAMAPGYRPRMVRRGITFAVDKGLPVIRAERL